MAEETKRKTAPTPTEKPGSRQGPPNKKRPPRRPPPGREAAAQKTAGEDRDASEDAPRPRRRRPPAGARRPAGSDQARRKRPPARRPGTDDKPASPAKAPAPPARIVIPDTITVREMAELVNHSPIEIMKVLMNYGIMAPITHSIDFDTAEVVAEELGIKIERAAKAAPQDEDDAAADTAKPRTLRQRLLDITPEERLSIRPPVVTVLGHVDHGKTTLLDAIRNTDVVSGEAGGITQHIGAYQVEHQGRKITFLDTPGHEAFTAIRARGAQATDIAVLVVAADDGVMPQTKEAIAHARAAGVPIMVALNKIDKPNANPDRVKQELAEQDLVIEEWGGDVICVPMSAKLRRGIDDLLDNLIVLADVEGFKADSEGNAVGTVIESELDKTRGPMATLLVQKGTLKVGDAMVVGATSGRVRAMFDSKGQPLAKATPSTPVQVLGLGDVATAGDIFRVLENERTAREQAARHAEAIQQRTTTAPPKPITLDDVFARMQAGKVKELRLILKADVDGSLEPIVNSLNQLSTDDLHIKLLHTGTGEITESDMMLASASEAIILGFSVPVSATAQRSDLADQVDIRLYNVIYELIADVDKALKGLLEPVYEERTIGKAEVRAVFKIPRRGNIAGCYVTDGEILRNAQVKVHRNGTVVFTGGINSLKRFQDDVNEVRNGFECGIGLEGFDAFEEGDVIEAFRKVRV